MFCFLSAHFIASYLSLYLVYELIIITCALTYYSQVSDELKDHMYMWKDIFMFMTTFLMRWQVIPANFVVFVINLIFEIPQDHMLPRVKKIIINNNNNNNTFTVSESPS